MTTYVAFVRAVMIGREGLHRDVLIDMFRRAGAADAVSYISTGNVSFTLPADRLDGLVAAVERDLDELLGRSTPVFVRSLDELTRLQADDPWRLAPYPDAVERTVILFRRAVPDALPVPFESPRGDFAVFAAGPREVFAVGRDVDGRRQAPGGTVERLAGEPMTSRAWSTIERIVAKLT